MMHDCSHDGVLSHFCTSKPDWLDISYTGHWIRHRGSALWPPESPDFPLLDFFPHAEVSGNWLSRRSDYTNELSYSPVGCLYFGRHSSDGKCTLIHSSASSSLSQYARWTL
ncbi:hypothetical protein TNCV_3633191 [Trichonephila clavipes]|nr:hypothetical protein TNCV_3633191 [Trichonephila clavipes]